MIDAQRCGRKNTTIGEGAMKSLLGYLAVMIVLTTTTAVALADSSYKQCLAVSNSAEVNFDSTLTVSIYENRTDKFCSIDVNPEPPTRTTVGAKPAIAAALNYRQLATEEPSTSDPAWDAYVPVLIQGMVQQWRDGKNADLLGSLENTLASQESETLKRCVVDSALKRVPFERRTDAISCGIIGSGSFAIEAVSEVLRLVLILPGPIHTP